MSEEAKVADTFNEFFSNVVKELKIEKNDNLLTDVVEETDPVLKATEKYKNHPSILRIKSCFKYPKVFSSKHFNVEDVKREINKKVKKCKKFVNYLQKHEKRRIVIHQPPLRVTLRIHLTTSLRTERLFLKFIFT